MPAAIAIESSQLQRWGGMLRQEIVTVAGRVEQAVAAQQGEINSAALADVPVLTGRLKGTVRKTGSGLRRRVRAGSARAIHAPFQEFGVSHHGAQPFLLVQANRATEAAFVNKVATAVLAGPIYR